MVQMMNQDMYDTVVRSDVDLSTEGIQKRCVRDKLKAEGNDRVKKGRRTTLEILKSRQSGESVLGSWGHVS